MRARRAGRLQRLVPANGRLSRTTAPQATGPNAAEPRNLHLSVAGVQHRPGADRRIVYRLWRSVGYGRNRIRPQASLSVP